jgi:Spy/CpxP family protein refolding chaperone
MFELKRNTRRAAFALALCASLSALPAAAQPGPGPEGDRIIHAIAAFKGQLNLNTSQQALWDTAAAAAKTEREAAKQRRQTLKQVVTDELAKPIPDLAHVAAAADQVQNDNIAGHRQVRAAWLQLYALFNADQAAVVKAGIAKRMARMAKFRAWIHQRIGGN